MHPQNRFTNVCMAGLVVFHVIYLSKVFTSSFTFQQNCHLTFTIKLKTQLEHKQLLLQPYKNLPNDKLLKNITTQLPFQNKSLPQNPHNQIIKFATIYKYHCRQPMKSQNTMILKSFTTTIIIETTMSSRQQRQ